MPKRNASIVLIMVLFLAFFVGCSDNESAKKAGQEIKAAENVVGQSEDVGGVPTGIQKGTEITIRATVDITAPLAGQLPPGQIFYTNVYDTLFYPAYGDYADLQGLIAKSWETSEDGLECVIQMNEGIKFVNGHEMDAQAVVGSFKITEPWQPGYFANIASYEATGKYELTFKFKSPYADFDYSFSLGKLGIMDPAVVKELGTTQQAGLAKGSSGPYYLADYKTGDYLVLKANPNYWNAARQPHIETITWKYIIDDNTAVSSLLAGELDFAEFGAFNIVQSIENEGFTIVKGKAETQPFWYNCDGFEEALQDIRVREGLAMMIDFDQVNDAAYDGEGWIHHTPFLEEITGDFNDGYEYNPERGVALLADAGYAPTDITIKSVASQINKPMFENIQYQLSKQGVTFDFEVFDRQASFSILSQGTWDVFPTHSGFNDVIRMDGIYNMFSSEAINAVFNKQPEGSMDEIHALVDKARSALTYEEQEVYIIQLAKILADEHAYMGTIRVPKWGVFSPKIKNLVFENCYYLWQMYYAYLDVE